MSSNRINLEKPEVAVPPLSDPQIGFDCEGSPSGEDLSGWLLFFLIMFVGGGSVLTLCVSIYSFDPDQTGGNIWFALSDLALAAVYFTAGITTILAFRRRDPDAVYLARTYIVLCFLTNILGIYVSDGADANTISKMVRPLVWSAIWFVYFIRSEKVNRMFPAFTRRMLTRDYLILAAAFLAPTMLIAFGIASGKNTVAEAEARAVENLVLGDNERTDGRIVFAIPEGFECETMVQEGITVYNLSDPSTGEEISLCSDYDDDATMTNFESYWSAWMADELSQLEYETSDNRWDASDGSLTFYRITNIRTENPLDWEYVVLFEKQTGKVCVVSDYSLSEGGSSLSYILDNLRFL